MTFPGIDRIFAVLSCLCCSSRSCASRHWSAEGDGTPRPLRAVSGRGTRPQHTSAAEDVLQLCTDGFDGFASAAGILQIDLASIEAGGLVGGERQPHDGSAQSKLLEAVARVFSPML